MTDTDTITLKDYSSAWIDDIGCTVDGREWADFAGSDPIGRVRKSGD